MGLKVVVISGLSGSGKSTAARALEDLGYFCVDNLPVTLLPKFLEICQKSSGSINRVSLVMDVRERDFLKECGKTLKGLREEGYKIELLFFDASDEIVIKRYSETRRRHPLAGSGTAIDGIAREREELSEVRLMADKVIDTTALNVHQLKELIFQTYGEWGGEGGLVVNLLSFGFSHGLPFNADLVMDVRFLKNPYFVAEMKGLTGEDPKVTGYIMDTAESSLFMAKFLNLLRFLVPLYEKEGKAYLTIAIGCTGGRHRSVAVANEIGKALEDGRYKIKVLHRDIGKA
ncbi:MAG: RNase adapter RapZ [Deltaproteobacteria bacterium]